MQTNFFSTQQEQEGMILLNKRITATSLIQQVDAGDLIRGIRNKKGY